MSHVVGHGDVPTAAESNSDNTKGSADVVVQSIEVCTYFSLVNSPS